ncbi:MAG: DUF2541 family protein [Bdellovibrionales bacterium]|nr:DUF2541 family protein [Bdellovibrionales bacterium]
MINLFLSLLFFTDANAGTFFIGQTRLNTRVLPDHDVLNLGSCPNFTTGVTHIQLQVRKRAADIDGLAVVYGNGIRDQLVVREKFARGSSSRWIDLQGAGRCIERISVTGDSDGLRGRRAWIRIYGEK